MGGSENREKEVKTGERKSVPESAADYIINYGVPTTTYSVSTTCEINLIT